MKYGIFLGYSFTPAWLAMPRPEREQFRQEHIAPLLAKYQDQLRGPPASRDQLPRVLLLRVGEGRCDLGAGGEP